MSTSVQIRDAGIAADAVDGFNSPAKQKAAIRSAYSNRPLLSLRRAKQFLGAAKFKLFLALFALSVVVLITARLSSWMGWNLHNPSSGTSRYKKMDLFFFSAILFYSDGSVLFRVDIEWLWKLNDFTNYMYNGLFIVIIYYNQSFCSEVKISFNMISLVWI